MNNNEALKLLKGNKKNILISMGVILLGIIAIFIGAGSSINPDDLTPVEYNTLISSKKDEPEQYATVGIKYLPYLFAEETTDYGSKKYYIVFDEFDYPYIARLKDETYQKLEKQYDNNEEINYNLKGFLYEQDEELKKLAIESHRELFEDSEITEANYELYFGKTYLDEDLVPQTAAEIIFLVIGIPLLFIGLICLIISIIAKLRFKKNIRKYNKDELEYELSKSSTLYFKKEEICLTDNYVISTFMGLDILKYEDILWLYVENRRYNFISIGKYLIARTKNKKIIQLAYSFRNEELLIQIMNKIAEKNNKIMLGFTKENNKSYKELIKNNKQI